MRNSNGHLVIKRNRGRKHLTDRAMAGIKVLAGRLGLPGTTVMSMMPRVMSVASARNSSQQVSRHGRRTHFE
jgi:hypothetical protein